MSSETLNKWHLLHCHLINDGRNIYFLHTLGWKKSHKIQIHIFWVFQRENYYCIEKYIENYEHHIFQKLILVYLFLLNQMISAENGVDHVLNSFWKDNAFAKNLDLAIQSLLANYPRREHS